MLAWPQLKPRESKLFCFVYAMYNTRRALNYIQLLGNYLLDPTAPGEHPQARPALKCVNLNWLSNSISTGFARQP